VNEDQILPLLGQGGISGALMFIIYKVGMAMVAAVNNLRTEVAEHTKADLAHHGEVKEELVALKVQVDSAITWQERTPVGGVPHVPSGGYRKPGPAGGR